MGSLTDKTIDELRNIILFGEGNDAQVDAFDELVARLKAKQLIIDEYEKLISDLQKDTW